MSRSTKWSRGATIVAALVSCGCTSPVDRVLLKYRSPSIVTPLPADDIKILEAGIARDDVRALLHRELLTHRDGCGQLRDNDAALVHAIALGPQPNDDPWVTAVIRASIGAEPETFAPLYAPIANHPSTRRILTNEWLELAPNCKTASPAQRLRAATNALILLDRSGGTNDVDAIAGLLGWYIYARSNGVPDLVEERLGKVRPRLIPPAWQRWFEGTQHVSPADRIHTFLDKAAPILRDQKTQPTPQVLARIAALANNDEHGVLDVVRVFPNAKPGLQQLSVAPGFLTAIDPVPYDAAVVETIFAHLSDADANADDKLRQLAFHRVFELPPAHNGDAEWLAQMGSPVIPKLLQHVDPEDRSRARVACRALARLDAKKLVDKLVPFFDRFEQKATTPAERAEISIVLAEGILALRPTPDPIADVVFARAAASAEPSLAGWAGRLRRERLNAMAIR